MDYINIGFRSYTIILFISTLSFIAGSNINCNGKAFHCVNSTHFKICVELGSGVSMTVDEFLIPCPRNTVCKQYNLFECEYELTTTLLPMTTQSEVTNEQFQTSDSSVWEQLDITTIFPPKQQQGMELSEKYYNNENATPSFTSSFLTDTVSDPVTSINTKDLFTNNKKNNISQSSHKELAISTTESGIGVTQTLPYNVNSTLVPDSSSIYNTEIKTTQGRTTIDSIKSKSSETLIQNNQNQKPNQVSSMSELPYPATVILLPGNLSNLSLQENIPRISNITHNQERNLDLIIIHNTTQIHKSDDNTLYHNTNTDQLNLTNLNVITDEKFTSIISNENKKSKVNIMITPELPTEHLAEATTSNYPTLLNTADAIETFLNEVINNKKNLEKLRVNDGEFIRTSSIIPETSAVKTNEMSSQIIQSGLNYDLDNNSITITNSSKNITAEQYETVTSLKPLSDLISKNETRSELVVVIGDTSLDNNNITTTETSNKITVDKYSGVASLKSLSDLISKNETSPKPIIIRLTTDLDNSNITTTKPINIITERISGGDPSLKPLLDLISKNETPSEPVVVIGETYPDYNNMTTTEASKNITEGITDGVTSLKPLLDLISKNETPSKPVVVIGETDPDNNNITTTVASNNITAGITDGVTSLKPLLDFISKNETLSEPVVVIGETGVDNNNITTTEASKNITAGITDGVTSLKPLSDFISKNETLSEPVVVIGETGVDNNNITTTEASKNITAGITDGVTSLKPLSDLILKNETPSEPVVVIGETDPDNNNITTTEASKNITAGITDGVMSLKPLSDLISKNETLSKPVVVIGEADLDKNNITTTEASKNITAGITNGVTSMKPLSDLILKNETPSEPVVVIGETDPDINNITTTEASKNITAGITDGVTSLKPLSDLISKNETLSKPVVVIGEADLDKKNITTTETSKNITADKYSGVASLKPLSDLISNVTRSESVVVIGGAGLDKKNVTGKYNEITSLKPKSDLSSKNETSPKPITITVATDLDNSNMSTTTEPSNNITAGISNEVTTLTSISDIIPTTSKIQPTDFKLLMVTDTFESFPKVNIIVNTSAIFTDQQHLNEETTSKFTKINDYIIVPKHFNTNSTVLISSTDSVISDLKQNTTSITTRLPTTLNKPTTLKDRNSEVLGNNNTTYNSDIINSVDNSLNKINNEISNVYETRRESDTSSITVESLAGNAAFKSANSMDVTNNTLTVTDKLAEYTVVSDNSKTKENTSKLEFKITTTPSTYLVSNTISKEVNSSKTKTVTIRLSESAEKEINKKGIINKNINNKDEILGKNSNLNLTKLSTENIFIPKLVTSNNHSLSPTLKLANANNNISDKDIEVKYNRVTNNLNEKSSKVKVINNNLNHTDNVVSSNSISIPSSFTKQLSTAIYNGENMSPTRTLDKATASKKHYEIEYKKSSQINQDGNEPVPARNIEHEGKETKYLLLNPYKQVDTKAIEINDTTRTLKESYNFSKASITVRNNIKRDFFINNMTKTAADKDTASKDIYDAEGSGFNKINTTTNKLVNVDNYKNHSELADYLPLNENSKDNISRNVTRPLLIVQEPLENVFNKSNLHKDNENFSLIRENRFENIAPVNNITSSNNFSKDKINNLGIVNTVIVTKPNKTFTYDRDISEVNSLSILRTRENSTNALNSTSKSSITKNNLLKNTSSQTNSINNNKILKVLSSSALEFSKIPGDHEKSSQMTLNILKMETNPLIINRPKLDVISGQDKITISERQFQIPNGFTKNNGNNPKNSSTAPINKSNYSDTKYGHIASKQEFSCTNRGKYSDTNDCNKFYICIGRVKPVIGLCPKGTVFSEYLKQCTKNISHCIRNNGFKCTAVGRFINILCNKTYFICAKNKSSFIRFTLQCQKGYYLDKYNIKCTPKLRNISKSDENNSKNTKELSFSKEMEGISVNSKNVFECQKEGKFKDPQDCSKYYICKMGKESTFRRKIKKCDSDEVFHGKKEKCVDVESYECNL